MKVDGIFLFFLMALLNDMYINFINVQICFVQWLAKNTSVYN